MKILACSLSVAAALVVSTVAGCANKNQERIDRAAAQVQRLAEKLDSQTTDAGVYVRVDDKDVKETDPWGTELQVVYAQGGVAENVTVRSAGPDREFHTPDDILAVATTVNLKGVGTGIQQGMEKTAAGAAKGFVKGTVAGVKESIKETLTGKRDDDKSNSDDRTPQP